MRQLATLGLVIALGAAVTSSAAASGDLPTYRAVYRVERNGKESGASEWSLTYDAARNVYRFVSSLSAKGPFRLAAPNPVVERAEFKYADGAIVPSEFWYEDGSRNGDESFHTVFDWDRGRAVTSAQGKRTELELRAGVLDRASMQVAVMRDMASAEGPRDYLLADGNEIKRYSYSRDGQEAVVAAGSLVDALVFVQQREGSSRRLVLWAAPELGFLPVRMERQKDGQTDTTFVLQSVELSAADDR